MSDQLDQLLVAVRADTDGFAADMQRMKGSFDSVLVDGFGRAGQILERSLLTALRKGSFGFEDLQKIALSVLDQIANRALRMGLDAIFGGAGGSGGGSGGGGRGGVGDALGGLLDGLIGSLLGLPGRATGGLVAPDRPYLVGERGPEVFVPTSAGRIETGALGGAPGRDVRVAIKLNAPRGTDAPAALQRSSRQMAAAVRRALTA